MFVIYGVFLLAVIWWEPRLPSSMCSEVGLAFFLASLERSYTVRTAETECQRTDTKERPKRRPRGKKKKKGSNYLQNGLASVSEVLFCHDVKERRRRLEKAS